MGNDVYIWEFPEVFQKRPKYVGNDVDLWEMAQICVEMTQFFDNRLKNYKKWLRDLGNGQNIWEMA